MIGGSKHFGMNKNVCHFSVGSLCCRNLQDVFRVGFSFQASVSFLVLVFLVAQLFVIVRLLWHCQLSLCAYVCVYYGIVLFVLFSFVVYVGTFLSLRDCVSFGLCRCMFVCALSTDLCCGCVLPCSVFVSVCVCVYLFNITGSSAVSAALSSS